MDTNNIKNFVVVGGGTSGWMTAAALGRVIGTENCTVTLIESDEIGTVGVGEATIPPIVEFNKLLGINADEMLRETQGTFKLGIEFINWGRIGDAYMHPFGVFGRTIMNVSFWHYWKKAYDLGLSPGLDAYSLNWAASKKNKFLRSANVANSPLAKIPHAYHFDATLYAQFLRKFSTNLGVNRIEGRVEHVKQNPDSGFITGVTLQGGKLIEGDFFFDCTGFRGLMIEQTLKTGYEDWSCYLPCNSAQALPTEAITPKHPYTKSIAHSDGWQWRIPLQHRTGNGIVYSTDFTSDENAHKTLMANLPSAAIGDPNQLRFLTGKRKQAWNKNCLAIGLASGFMEPLESTSIHLVQSAIMRFFSLLPRKTEFKTEMDRFNSSVDEEFRSVRDFLILHYKATKRDDSELWNYCRNMPVPDSLQDKLELYKSGSWLERNKQELFGVDSWLAVLDGQHVKARNYSPLVDRITDEKLKSILSDTRIVLEQCTTAMPKHEDFIKEHCQTQIPASSN
ncbi:MAG: tryptophan 7-halogenase [Gammaproteobacteria bacterium]|nr:tryptophan 7-halogenase [Gammaproteobacteria bacterium]